MPLFRGTRYPILTAGARARLFYDSFSGADGTALTSHAPEIDRVGGGWKTDTLPTAVNEIVSNQDRITNNAGGETVACLWYADCGAANVLITCDMVFDSNNGYTGILARRTNSNNYWLARWSMSNNRLEIYERAAAWVLRATAAKSGPTFVPYSASLLLSGSSILFTVNGTTSVSYTSTANLTATRHGLYMPDSGAIVDNFQVVAA